jgi:hypothetical protein
VAVVVLGVLEAAEPELMSVLEPVLPVEPVVPEAPMEVPLPVVPPMAEPVPVVPPAPALVVVSVLAEPVMLPVPEVPPAPAVLEVSAEGVVVDGVVLEVVEPEVEVSVLDFWPQAVRARADIRARAAIEVFIRYSLRFVSMEIVRERDSVACCLRRILGSRRPCHVVCHCRRL